jgi:hydrogenase maturation factor
MCLGDIGTVAALADEGGVPVALVRVEDGTVRRCGVFVPGVEVGSAVLLHLGHVVEVLDRDLAADALALRGAGLEPRREESP